MSAVYVSLAAWSMNGCECNVTLAKLLVKFTCLLSDLNARFSQKPIWPLSRSVLLQLVLHRRCTVQMYLTYLSWVVKRNLEHGSLSPRNCFAAFVESNLFALLGITTVRHKTADFTVSVYFFVTRYWAFKTWKNQIKSRKRCNALQCVNYRSEALDLPLLGLNRYFRNSVNKRVLAYVQSRFVQCLAAPWPLILFFRVRRIKTYFENLTTGLDWIYYAQNNWLLTKRFVIARALQPFWEDRLVAWSSCCFVYNKSNLGEL